MSSSSEESSREDDSEDDSVEEVSGALHVSWEYGGEDVVTYSAVSW
jgi:hypothetical protein